VMRSSPFRRGLVDAAKHSNDLVILQFQLLYMKLCDDVPGLASRPPELRTANQPCRLLSGDRTKRTVFTAAPLVSSANLKGMYLKPAKASPSCSSSNSNADFFPERH
jgi:hypothetical protein